MHWCNFNVLFSGISWIRYWMFSAPSALTSHSSWVGFKICPKSKDQLSPDSIITGTSSGRERPIEWLDWEIDIFSIAIQKTGNPIPVIAMLDLIQYVVQRLAQETQVIVCWRCMTCVRSSGTHARVTWQTDDAWFGDISNRSVLSEVDTIKKWQE